MPSDRRGGGAAPRALREWRRARLAVGEAAAGGATVRLLTPALRPAAGCSFGFPARRGAPRKAPAFPGERLPPPDQPDHKGARARAVRWRHSEGKARRPRARLWVSPAAVFPTRASNSAACARAAPARRPGPRRPALAASYIRAPGPEWGSRAAQHAFPARKRRTSPAKIGRKPFRAPAAAAARRQRRSVPFSALGCLRCAA